jgi:DNA-binding transcriptional LysR family regulator
MSMLDWSDLRYALAVGQLGSVAAAARRLGVNATTVQRRLDALELSLGARLFERSRSGYKPTDAGTLLLEQARGMADQAEEIERRVLGRDRELTGPLRLATAFVVMEHLLPQPLADFARAYPGIEVEVVENAFLVDLARRQAEEAPGPTQLQADVALRLSTHVSEHLVGRQLGMTHCRTYALRGAPGLPQALTPLPQLLREAPWVAFERDGHHRVYDHWMRKHLAQSDVRVRVDIFNAAAAMLRTGVGIGILPSFMA